MRTILTRTILKSSFLLGTWLLLSCTEDAPPPLDNTPGNISTIAGTAGAFDNTGDGGPALSAKLGFTVSLATDPQGNIYVADAAANVIRRIDGTSGIITTLAGTFLGFNVVDPTPYSGDGGQANTAHLNVPYGVATDAAGNVYIADSGNGVVRKVNITTGVITKIAGKAATAGYSGDGGPAVDAELNNPYDVTVDSDNNVYIVDSQNHVVRKIDAATGNISTIAGSGPANGGYAGDDGPATSAKLNSPQAVAVDADGNVFIVDAGNHALRRVDATTGIITTVAGTGTYGFSGDSGASQLAQLYAPSDVAVDANGDVYIADQGNQRIRKITTSTGIITTLAGNGVAGYSGDGGPATSAKLSTPQGVAVDADGVVFISESGNSVIRAVVQ